MQKIMIVEDQIEIRSQLKWGLGKDYHVLQAGKVREALALFEQHGPRVVLLDLGLPPDADGTAEGMRALQEILSRSPSTKAIVLTGNNERAVALQAVNFGAYDFYQKPIDLEELKILVRRAFHLAALEEENCRLKEGEGRSEMAGMLGQCPAMHDVFRTIRKVAGSDVPVLVLGESGTGKELVAAAIHGGSRRRGGPFIPINCGAIPETLLEAELFGYEKGAFTGAQTRVQGKVEYAHRGTLFLDEIGELSLPLQVKLLRFLQNRVIQRVGGREDITVDGRIIAATNIDIVAAIAAGTFREDLYYRIGVITIHLPPLREREGDIPLLANFFLHRGVEGGRKKAKGFSAATLDALQRHPWPGNVRELENRVKRAAILADGPILEPHHLGLAAATEEETPAGAGTADLTLREGRDRVERAMVVAAIEKNAGNIVKTAETLGISRPAVYSLMKKHGLYF